VGLRGGAVFLLFARFEECCATVGWILLRVIMLDRLAATTVASTDMSDINVIGGFHKKKFSHFMMVRLFGLDTQ
jgi:hypothetical protein